MAGKRKQRKAKRSSVWVVEFGWFGGIRQLPRYPLPGGEVSHEHLRSL